MPEESRMEAPKESKQIIDAVREDIVDAVNDLKQQNRIWDLSAEQMKACDSIIKKMVLNSKEDSVAHTYDLVRCLFDILRDLMKNRTKQSEHTNA